ncbi:MAG: hypothetical protein FWG21_01075 [Oscillospiraceae bacterium]|nr:hypothetical protein [Oscillospiraceae bacterium]
MYTCDSFSVRFCQSTRKHFNNTVLSLSALQKFDKNPFIVCIVTPELNILLLANSTLLSKISHSSHKLRVDNIRGSFNGSDIIQVIEKFSNCPENFESLFQIHATYTFKENLTRLVEATNNIAPTGQKYNPSTKDKAYIKDSPARANKFVFSTDFQTLKEDLDNRVKKAQNEIVIAALIDNVNIRGRVIEYLITSDSESLSRKQVIELLYNNKPIQGLKMSNNLGDYSKEFEYYSTQTDIKTKVLFSSSNPKGYNIDKMLEFLSEPNSVFMIYIVGIDDDGCIKAALSSVFDSRLLEGSLIMSHWAGRNSRGTTQFIGNSLSEILANNPFAINEVKATEYLENLLLL